MLLTPETRHAAGLLSAARPMETKIPFGWDYVSAPQQNSSIRLTIALLPDNPVAIEHAIYNISTPGSEQYGKFLSRDAAAQLLLPSHEALSQVHLWLNQSGIDINNITERRENIELYTSIGKAEDLLNTTFGVYSDPDGKRITRALDCSLPPSIAQYVEMVQPTAHFGAIRKPKPFRHLPPRLDPLDHGRLDGREAQGESLHTACDTGETMTPRCLRQLYNIPSATPSNPDTEIPNDFMAFANFLEQYPSQKDLANFTHTYADWVTNSNFTWSSIHGGLLTQNSSHSIAEANLDAQYLLTTGWPVRMHAYSTAGRAPLLPPSQKYASTSTSNTNEPLLSMLDSMLSLPAASLPHTLSISYGEEEQSVPQSYRIKVCNLFGLLGARGVSILTSAGDQGPGGTCRNNDPSSNTSRFTPLWPASCPYVTSVGATEGIEPERAASFSGGGFSSTFARPAYQDLAVPKYLSHLGDRFKGLYNAHGRGIPDVAAAGTNFLILEDGDENHLDGTSAATPVFAGIIARLNSALLHAGKSPLGFLNPWLYQCGHAGLTDIVEGGSVGCEGTGNPDELEGWRVVPEVEGASWNATEGWDPVTGLGTPDFERLLRSSGLRWVRRLGKYNGPDWLERA